MRLRVKHYLTGAGLLAFGFGVVFIDSIPTWLLAAVAAIGAVGFIVCWIHLEREADREAGTRT